MLPVLGAILAAIGRGVIVAAEVGATIARGVGQASKIASSILGQVFRTTAKAATQTAKTVRQKKVTDTINKVKKIKKQTDKLKNKKKKRKTSNVNKRLLAKELAVIFLRYIKNTIQSNEYGLKSKSPFTKRIQKADGQPLWYKGSLYMFNRKKGAFNHLSTYKAPPETESNTREKIDLQNYMSINIVSDSMVDVGFEEHMLYKEAHNAYSPRLKSRTVKKLLDNLEFGAEIPADPKTAKGRRVLGWYASIMKRMGRRKNKMSGLGFISSAFANKKGKKVWQIPPRPFFDRAVKNFKLHYNKEGVRITRKTGQRRIQIRITKD